jgi:hypothetical protein
MMLWCYLALYGVLLKRWTLPFSGWLKPLSADDAALLWLLPDSCARQLA